MKAFEFHVGIGNVSLRCCDNLFLATYGPTKVTPGFEKTQHPHVIAATQKTYTRLWKVPSGKKKHHGTACFICSWSF